MVTIENNGGKNRIPFSQRLFWSIFFMFLGIVFCFLLFQYQREKEFAQEKLSTLLDNYNYLLYKKCQKETDLPSTVRGFIEDIPQRDLRVTIIAPNGEVLFDNAETEGLSNHNDRSEVQKARLNGKGFAIRTSQTTGIRYFYSATNIDSYIYRSALRFDPYVRSSLSINKDFIYFFLLMSLLFFFVLSKFTYSIGQTIAKLRDFANNVKNGHIPLIDYVFPNDELGDISQNIVKLYHLQQKAKNEVAMERDKIVKHFQYSKEGFAMFSLEGKEILSNTLFIQYINVISDSHVNQADEAIYIEELNPIHQFLNDNIRNLKRDRKVLRKSVTIDKGGKIFLVECILFVDNSYELSINDISRQEEESRLKRQLTQNISHELKTPVSSIQGYLETILSNPEIAPDKLRFFLERCYSQSTRLTLLLRDISVLNRLEEASNMFDLTEVNLNQLISGILTECSREIEEKKAKTEVKLPAKTVMEGNQSLLYSIFRNLLDNALAYAGENIKITINCYKEDSKYYYFSFSDNGVGIPEEHINRIFERFYRVDKGRSRKIGGTGLGLSIVIIVAAIFSKRLRKQSLSIERRFLENFSGTDDDLSNAAKKELSERLPFHELHLVEQALPPYLSFLGQSLKEINFRQRYGLNIVSIIRGDTRLNIPNGDERLFPYDHIVVVGTDEELEHIRAAFNSERQTYQAKGENTSNGFLSVEPYAIEPESPLNGQTISQSHIKERGNCLIIGIERDGKAIMNPSADTLLQTNDVLWLAGERKRILAMFGSEKKAKP